MLQLFSHVGILDILWHWVCDGVVIVGEWQFVIAVVVGPLIGFWLEKVRVLNLLFTPLRITHHNIPLTSTSITKYRAFIKRRICFYIRLGQI